MRFHEILHKLVVKLLGHEKTSPKGFSASKCDVGNYFQNLRIFLGNFWDFFGGFFWRNFLGGIFWLDLFGKNYLGGILWELSMIVYIFKCQLVSYIFKVS